MPDIIAIDTDLDNDVRIARSSSHQSASRSGWCGFAPSDRKASLTVEAAGKEHPKFDQWTR
jgi:hypothetical protein